MAARPWAWSIDHSVCDCDCDRCVALPYDGAGRRATGPWCARLQCLLRSEYCHFLEYHLEYVYLLRSKMGKNGDARLGRNGGTAA